MPNAALSLLPAGSRTVEVVSPAPRAVWSALSDQQASTPIESTPEWMDCIEAAGHHIDASRLYRFGDGRSVVVPLAAPRLGGRWAPLSSLPFDWGYGGVVTGRDLLDTDQIDAVLEDLAALPTVRLRLAFPAGTPKGWSDAARRFPTVEERTVHRIDLTGGMDAVLANYRPNRRKSVRRAERLGIDIEVDRTGRRLGVFYELFDLSIERWAAEQHEPRVLCRWRNHRANSRAKLDAVARRLGDRCAVWTAWKDGRPAAASIVLSNGLHVTSWKSAADIGSFGSTGAMDLLKTSAIAAACAAGAQVFDLGESRPGSKLAEFKSAYGAREYPVLVAEQERLPLRAAGQLARTGVRRAVGFHDR